MSYGQTEVLAGLDLEVQPGDVFAFLGPNGAGKTTTVEILEGYRRRTAGEGPHGEGQAPRRSGSSSGIRGSFWTG